MILTPCLARRNASDKGVTVVSMAIRFTYRCKINHAFTSSRPDSQLLSDKTDGNQIRRLPPVQRIGDFTQPRFQPPEDPLLVGCHWLIPPVGVVFNQPDFRASPEIVLGNPLGKLQPNRGLGQVFIRLVPLGYLRVISTFHWVN